MTTSRQTTPAIKREVERRGEGTTAGKVYTPYTDIYETADALVVIMDMPGVDRGNLEVSLDRDHLRIDGEIDYTRYAGLRPLHTEYNVGHFTRSFSLSRRINRDGITAEMRDGVLRLHLPKVEDVKPRRVKIM